MPYHSWRRTRWDPGQIMAFSGLDGKTDYKQGLTARTMSQPPGIDIKIPAQCRVVFEITLAESPLLASDHFDYPGTSERVRGLFLNAHHMLIEGPCRVLDADQNISVATEKTRTLIGSASAFDPALINVDFDEAWQQRAHWISTHKHPEQIPQTSHSSFFKALSNMKSQVYTPEGAIKHRWTTPDRWPHRAMWLWDSVFHAAGWRHIDPEMARDAISAVIACQTDDGFIPLSMAPDHAEKVTQPPILTLGVKLISDIAPDNNWLAAMYPALVRYLAWDKANRDKNNNGLLEWHIAANQSNCRSGESGMDNSPRFDDATLLDAVDFNSFLALEYEILVEFALKLGREKEADKWRQEHSRLCQLIRERFWSDKAQFFLDYDLDHDRPSPVLASAGFLPMLCGAATAHQAQALVAAFENPQLFGTPLPVPSIAANDLAHYSKDMWRGPVWVNLNWLIAESFDRYGYRQQASRLRLATRQELERIFERHGTFFEFYDDRKEVDPPSLLRKGVLDPDSIGHQVLFDYGWTSTLYVDIILREFVPELKNKPVLPPINQK